MNIFKRIFMAKEVKKTEESKAGPVFSGPKYVLIHSDDFSVEFPSWNSDYSLEVTKVIKPTWDAFTESFAKKVLVISGSLRKTEVFIGKPTKISNISTDNEVATFVKEFNEMKPKHVCLIEYCDGVPLLSTLFYDPVIAQVRLGKFKKTEGDAQSPEKTFEFVIYFNGYKNERIE